jgi:predicted GNAT family acetyltransferase
MSQVRDVPDRRRYEIEEDGAVAGFVTYRDRDDVRTLVHTEIDDAYEGRGLASKLIRWALDDIRDRGLELVPMCPFVQAFIEKHPEYADLTREQQADRSA